MLVRAPAVVGCRYGDNNADSVCGGEWSAARTDGIAAASDLLEILALGRSPAFSNLPPRIFLGIVTAHFLIRNSYSKYVL
jgi:hypothetical protein